MNKPKTASDWQEDKCPRCGNYCRVDQTTGDRICVTCEQADDGPQPLFREIPDSAPYPMDALGDLLGGAARAIWQRSQAPDAICAQTVLAVANLALQGHANVELPTRAVRPISCYFVTVAESGERKTTADNLALRPIRDREAELSQRYRKEQARYDVESAAWEKQRADVLRRAKELQPKRSALHQLGPRPDPPLLPMLTCPDPTSEGLFRAYMEGLPSLGIFSSEGAQFVGGYGMSPEHRLKTGAALSSFWDGESNRWVRAKRGAVILDGKRLAAHLLMQPKVSARLLSSEELIDQGLLTRLLVAAPGSTAGSRFWRDPEPESQRQLEVYGDRILDMLRRPLPVEETTPSVLSPRTVKLDEEARTIWIRFADTVEGELGEMGDYYSIRGFANKLPEHAVRLAAVVALSGDFEKRRLTAEDMARGIELANYYASEALRLVEAHATDPDLLLGEKLLHWLHERWCEEVVSLPDIYQYGPSRKLRKKTEAKRIVGILEDHRWLEQLPEGAEVAGIKRRECWRIARRV